jgi:hypothetical protein
MKGEVFKVRVFSVWKETNPHQKMGPDATQHKVKHWAELEEK